jgi:deoxyadenosine/deoxycytidine kinase
MNFQIISIEGNIGSGKSTLLEHLKEYYKNNHNVIFLREPVDEWVSIKDKNGNTMIEKFYENQEKYSFSFQMMAYISRLSILRETLRNQEQANNVIIITERTLYTDKHVFAKMLYDQDKIEDVNYQIYNKWFNEFANCYPINDIIYVKTDPINCYHRINKRARSGEEVIPLSYLEDCHKYHEQFLEYENEDNKNWNKLNIDGNEDIYENPENMKLWIEQIHNLIK